MTWYLPQVRIVFRHPALDPGLLLLFLFHWEAMPCFMFLFSPFARSRAGWFHHVQQCCLRHKHKCPRGCSWIFSAHSPVPFLCLLKIPFQIKRVHFRIMTFHMIFIVYKNNAFQHTQTIPAEKNNVTNFTQQIWTLKVVISLQFQPNEKLCKRGMLELREQYPQHKVVLWHAEQADLN